MSHTTYEYATMPFVVVQSLTSARTKLSTGAGDPDSYMSKDAESNTYQLLLDRGFRWVRTDEGVAIFERQGKMLARID